LSPCLVNIRNGPPEVGKLDSATEKTTPIPSGLLVAETEPLIFPRGSSGLKNSFSGRTARYVAPAGLFWTTVALPSSPVVMFCARTAASSVVKTTEVIVVACMLMKFLTSFCMLQENVVRKVMVKFPRKV
jgi:hypothetical protein